MTLSYAEDGATMEDYGASAGAVGDVVPNLNHSQLDDPVKAATCHVPIPSLHRAFLAEPRHFDA